MMRKWHSSLRYFNCWPRETRDSLVKALTLKVYVSETEKMIRRSATTTTSLITSEMIVLIYKRIDHLMEAFWIKVSIASSRKVSWKHGMDFMMKMIQKEKLNKPILHRWLLHSLIQNSSQVLPLNLVRKIMYILTYLVLILFMISWAIVKIRQGTWRLLRNSLIFYLRRNEFF